MPFSTQVYQQFCQRLTKIDFFAEDPRLLPKAKAPAKLPPLINDGAAFLPQTYRQNYATPLSQNLPSFLVQLRTAPAAKAIAFLEPYCAPVYQHAKGATAIDVGPELKRFLAVVSNLYRSFLSAKKRVDVNVPVVTDVPPLAFFQSNGTQGPYTITSEAMQRMLGTPVSVVSLPGSYRSDPIIWASLTHEVCGHDVAHADANLIPELVDGVRKLFKTPNFAPGIALTGDALSALIWSYWIDEAVADVYGLLNMGPSFPFNLGAFFYAFAHQAYVKAGRPAPPLGSLRMSSDPGDQGKMDEHPTDILRLHLAIGVIESLPKLSPAKRQTYIDAIEAVAKLAANGENSIELQGYVEVSHDDWRMVNTTIPLPQAQAAARQVGAFIATAQLQALRGKSIQDIETWDDTDEATAANVATRIAGNQSIVSAGDDAQLLAGATMAVLTDASSYDRATNLLNAALDDSYQHDPIWAGLSFDQMFSSSFLARLISEGGKRATKKAPRKKAKR
jgi:hypothetical protein